MRGRACALVLAAGGLLTALAAAACGDDSEAPAAGVGPATGNITVFAASSLTDAFTVAAKRFRELHPNAAVTFNFAASSALAVQINEGAPADVFASADGVQMKTVADKGNVAGARIFATNTPVVVVPRAGSPVGSFDDLAKAGVRLVLAGPEVPIGRYSREILAKAGAAKGEGSEFERRVLANLRSNETNVRAVLTKVALGEADAGIVYATDVGAAAQDVRAIHVPAAYNVVAEYPIALTVRANNRLTAEAWVTFLLSAEGQAILAKFGFARVAP